MDIVFGWLSIVLVVVLIWFFFKVVGVRTILLTVLPFAWVGRMFVYFNDIDSRIDIRRRGKYVMALFLTLAIVLMWWDIVVIRYLVNVVSIPDSVSFHRATIKIIYWGWRVDWVVLCPVMFMPGNPVASGLLFVAWLIGWGILCAIPAQMMTVDDFRRPISMKVVNGDGNMKYETVKYGMVEVAFNTLRKVKGYVSNVNRLNSVSYIVELSTGAQTDQQELSASIPTMEVATGLTFGGITQELNEPNKWRVRVSRGLPIVKDKFTGEVRGNVPVSVMPFHPGKKRKALIWHRPNPVSRWEFPLALDPEVVWANIAQDDVNFGIFGKMGLGKTRLFAWIVYAMHRIDRLCFTVLVDLSKGGRGFSTYKFDPKDIENKPDNIVMREYLRTLTELPNFLLITNIDELMWFIDGLKVIEEMRSQMIQDHPGVEKIQDFENIIASPWKGNSDFDVFDPMREFRIHFGIEEIGSTWKQFGGNDNWEKAYNDICGLVFRGRDVKFNASILTQHPTMDEVGRIRPYLTRCGFGLDAATNKFVYGFEFTSRQAGGLFSIMRSQQSTTIGFAIAPNCHPRQMSSMMANAVDQMHEDELKECLIIKRILTRQYHPMLLKRMRDHKFRAHKARDIEMLGDWKSNYERQKNRRINQAESLATARARVGTGSKRR